ncbi:MAG: lipoate--protein ligase [Bacteroidales bacterium]|nr:lipoate--protein ligase [Bacteroidales bacterium]
MICIIDKSTDPYRNLAAEEYIFERFDEPVFRLWQNSPSVIIGQNQNALAEIDYAYVKENKIPVVRRLSGGGAVFHDLGNVNFTFIAKVTDGNDTADLFRQFTRPILEALEELGVNARLEGRNDLTINGLKFSGNAIYKQRDKVMMHGTLLFNSSISDLSSALRYRPEKFSDKAVKSTRSRVTNISDHLHMPMTVREFIKHLEACVASHADTYEYSAGDLRQIDILTKTKYRTDEWNFGHSPKYTFTKVVKYPCGLFEIFMEVRGGVIHSLEIKGDYFFTLPTSEFCSRMIGCRHTEKEIAGRISELPTGEYFNGLNNQDLLNLFF